MTMRDQAIEAMDFGDKQLAADALDALLAFLAANGPRVVAVDATAEIVDAGKVFAVQWRDALDAAPNPLAEDAPRPDVPAPDRLREDRDERRRMEKEFPYE